MTSRTPRRLVALLAVVVTFASVVLGSFVEASPASAAPGPPSSPEWWFDTWNVPALWAAGANGSGITVAEIDTGVNGAIPAIAGNLAQGKDFGTDGGNGWVDREVDPFGHGTAMASLIVATKGAHGVTGLAPNATLLPIALPINGTDDAASSGSDHLPEAIRWAADHGARIINMSLGGKRYPDQDASPCPADEQDAITYAVSKGILVVAAAGNDGDTGNPAEDPAVCVGAIAVGSVDQAGNVPSFSARHPYITLTAPGVNIATLSRVPGTAYNGQGTSHSAAIVSASLALIWSKFPTLSAREILSKALSSLDHPFATRDPAYGFGIINPARAIASGNPQAPNAVFDAVQPFVQQLAAQTSASSTVPVAPAALSARVPGVFAIGDPPSAVTASVVHSALVAVGGLLALLVLLVLGWRSRRRRAAFGQTTTAALAFTGSAVTSAKPPTDRRNPRADVPTERDGGLPAVSESSEASGSDAAGAGASRSEASDSGASGSNAAGSDASPSEAVIERRVTPDRRSAPGNGAASEQAPPVVEDPSRRAVRSTDWSEITSSDGAE